MTSILNRLLILQLSITLSFLIILGFFLKLTPHQYILVILVGTLLALVLNYIIGRMYIAPIQEMNKVTHKISQGDFKHRLPVLRKDELGDKEGKCNR